MKILVTSGGTKIPIDMVRNISNMSKGTFGSKIATQFLEMGHEVIFLRAKHSRSPFELNVDFYKKLTLFADDEFDKKSEFVYRHREYYTEFQYSTFDEYQETLERLIKTHNPDVVLLAAAVSDYGVDNFVDGKIRSKDSLTIQLKPLPKIINLIKNEWGYKGRLVGFKLLVNSTDEELVASAKKSILDNGCDMVVANDLRDIKNDNHRLVIVEPTIGGSIVEKFESNNADKNYLAKIVAGRVINL